jgi:hypothetical protein
MGFRKLILLGTVLGLAAVGAAQAQLGVYGMYSGQRFSGVVCPSSIGSCAASGGAVKPFGGALGAYYDFKTLGPVLLGVDVRADLLHSNKRADNYSGADGAVHEYNVLAGLRGSFHAHYEWLRPYAEIAGGYTRNNTTGVYTTTTTTTTFSPETTPSTAPIAVTSGTYNPSLFSNYVLVKGFVGLDIKIFPFMDLRAVELGIGEALGTPLNAQSVSTADVVDGNQFINGQPDPNYGKITSSTSTVTGNGFGSNTHQNLSIGAGIVFHLP